MFNEQLHGSPLWVRSISQTFLAHQKGTEGAKRQEDFGERLENSFIQSVSRRTPSTGFLLLELHHFLQIPSALIDSGAGDSGGGVQTETFTTERSGGGAVDDGGL